jgi:hypothetical protein
MPDIKIIQLSPAPENLWRFHAIHAETDGDAIVYISRVMTLALVEDEHDLDGPVPRRLVPIDADAMTYDSGPSRVLVVDGGSARRRPRRSHRVGREVDAPGVQSGPRRSRLRASLTQRRNRLLADGRG